MGIKITGSSFTGHGGRSFSFEVEKDKEGDNKLQELERKVREIFSEAAKKKKSQKK